MKSKLFAEKPETIRTSAARWVRIFPAQNKGYQLYDVLQELNIVCILFNVDDNWIYDGTALTIAEQEELAGYISGNQKEMNDLIKDLYEI